MKKKAILFAGGVDPSNCHLRYENDLTLAYMTLIEKGGYKKEDIKIFFGYGKTIYYKGEKIKTQSAQKRMLIEELRGLQLELEPDDKFVLVISNHGSPQGIHTWGWDIIEKQEIQDLLQNIKSQKLVVMGQCYGGDFLETDVESMCLLTANEKHKVSYARLPLLEYDEFLYHFFSYLYGEYPDSHNQIIDSKLDIESAYNFALSQDQYNPSSRKYVRQRGLGGKSIIEIPCFKNTISELSSFWN